jgi:hypothetical protein
MYICMYIGLFKRYCNLLVGLLSVGIYIHRSIYICIHINIHRFIYLYLYLSICMHIYIYTYLYMCIFIFMVIYSNKYIFIYIFIYTRHLLIRGVKIHLKQNHLLRIKKGIIRNLYRLKEQDHSSQQRKVDPPVQSKVHTYLHMFKCIRM